MKVFEINEFGIDKLTVSERAETSPKATQVKIKFHAVSINYRDLMMIKGMYNPRLKMPLVPFSDGAGEIIEIGEAVTKFKIGDRVMPIFMQNWIDGAIDTAKARSALGGDLDGCLRETGIFEESGVVCIPNHFSYEEAATLPCAAVTAYHALFESGGIRPDDTVLLQGTGGVSIFALQMANVLGCRTIVISSSDEKLETVKNMGADDLINYKTTADWDKKILDLTEKRGVDIVVEVGGAATIGKSINAVRMGGNIAVIGALSGNAESSLNPVSILMKSIRLQGIYVGSRHMFEDLNRFLNNYSHLKPVVDTVFSIEDIAKALNYMESGAHFGKIVLKIQ